MHPIIISKDGIHKICAVMQEKIKVQSPQKNKLLKVPFPVRKLTGMGTFQHIAVTILVGCRVSPKAIF